MTIQLGRLPKSRCKGLCENEASIDGCGTGRAVDKLPRYNSKCSYCEKALNTDNLRCYCCGNRLRKRRSRINSLKFKEELIVRI